MKRKTALGKKLEEHHKRIVDSGIPLLSSWEQIEHRLKWQGQESGENSMAKITDWKIRKLSPATRRELFSYVPRHRVTQLDGQTLEVILRAYGREDLYQRVTAA